MAVCCNATMYYPLEDPKKMGPEYDVFNAIPYLRDFCLSRPRVIYHPPTVSELQAAGAIPVEQFSGLNSRLPTITISVEVGPCKGNFREFDATIASVGFLQPPEREGLEAVAEKLRQCSFATSEQDYWSDEYWGSIQALGSVSDDSFACTPVLKKKKKPGRKLTRVVSGNFFFGRDEVISTANCGCSTTEDRHCDVGDFCDLRSSSRFPCNNAGCAMGSNLDSYGTPKSCYTVASKKPKKTETRLGVATACGLSQRSRNNEPLVGSKSKLPAQRKVAGRSFLSKGVQHVGVSTKTGGVGCGDDGKGCSTMKNTFFDSSSRLRSDVPSCSKGKVKCLGQSADNTTGKNVTKHGVIANSRDGRRRFDAYRKKSLLKKQILFSTIVAICSPPQLTEDTSAVSGVVKDVEASQSLAIFPTGFDAHEDCSSKSVQKSASGELGKSDCKVVSQTGDAFASVESAGVGSGEVVLSVMRQNADYSALPTCTLDDAARLAGVAPELKHKREFLKNCCTLM